MGFFLYAEDTIIENKSKKINLDRSFRRFIEKKKKLIKTVIVFRQA